MEGRKEGRKNEYIVEVEGKNAGKGDLAYVDDGRRVGEGE